MTAPFDQFARGLGSRLVQAPDFPSRHRWPVSLGYQSVRLTPFRRADIDEVNAIRQRNRAWLSPWEATPPRPSATPRSPEQGLRTTWRQAKRGHCLPWLVRWASEVDGAPPLIGQCTVANIVYGSAQTASMGYWIDRRYAGHSIMPLVVALATDYAMASLGLHRVEICIRTENKASRRVVEKLGFRYEGQRPRYIHIAGDWRDHDVYALTAEEAPEGLLARLPAPDSPPNSPPT